MVDDDGPPLASRDLRQNAWPVRSTRPPATEPASSSQHASRRPPPAPRHTHTLLDERDRLFVDNLPADCDEEDLYELFSEFGGRRIVMRCYPDTSAAFARVEVSSGRMPFLFINRFSHYKFNGRSLSVRLDRNGTHFDGAVRGQLLSPRPQASNLGPTSSALSPPQAKGAPPKGDHVCRRSRSPIRERLSPPSRLLPHERRSRQRSPSPRPLKRTRTAQDSYGLSRVSDPRLSPDRTKRPRSGSPTYLHGSATSHRVGLQGSQRPVSPVRRPVSPVRRPVSPVRRPVSPVRRPLSPARRPLSPARRLVSPARRPVSPARRPVSPSRRSASPHEPRHDSPRRALPCLSDERTWPGRTSVERYRGERERRASNNLRLSGDGRPLASHVGRCSNGFGNVPAEADARNVERKRARVCCDLTSRPHVRVVNVPNDVQMATLGSAFRALRAQTVHPLSSDIYVVSFNSERECEEALQLEFGDNELRYASVRACWQSARRPGRATHLPEREVENRKNDSTNDIASHEADRSTEREHSTDARRQQNSSAQPAGKAVGRGSLAERDNREPTGDGNKKDNEQGAAGGANVKKSVNAESQNDILSVERQSEDVLNAVMEQILASFVDKEVKGQQSNALRRATEIDKARKRTRAAESRHRNLLSATMPVIKGPEHGNRDPDKRHRSVRWADELAPKPVRNAKPPTDPAAGKRDSSWMEEEDIQRLPSLTWREKQYKTTESKNESSRENPPAVSRSRKTRRVAIDDEQSEEEVGQQTSTEEPALGPSESGVNVVYIKPRNMRPQVNNAVVHVKPLPRDKSKSNDKAARIKPQPVMLDGHDSDVVLESGRETSDSDEGAIFRPRQAQGCSGGARLFTPPCPESPDDELRVKTVSRQSGSKNVSKLSSSEQRVAKAPENGVVVHIPPSDPKASHGDNVVFIKPREATAPSHIKKSISKAIKRKQLENRKDVRMKCLLRLELKREARKKTNEPTFTAPLVIKPPTSSQADARRANGDASKFDSMKVSGETESPVDVKQVSDTLLCEKEQSSDDEFYAETFTLRQTTQGTEAAHERLKSEVTSDSKALSAKRRGRGNTGLSLAEDVAVQKPNHCDGKTVHLKSRASAEDVVSAKRQNRAAGKSAEEIAATPTGSGRSLVVRLRLPDPTEVAGRTDSGEGELTTDKARASERDSHVLFVPPNPNPGPSQASVVVEDDDDGRCARMRVYVRGMRKDTIVPLPKKPDDLTSRVGTKVSSRDHRQVNRAIRKGMKEMNLKHDLLNLNSLKLRKKQVMCRRSRIHGMGLYAQEKIDSGEFIIEYIGDIIRRSVADMREAVYRRQGIGDSYLFRLDAEYVIDATRRGGIARYINHSCEPNVLAKTITVDGQRRIVFYSKSVIKEDEELTYDYKFDIEGDDKKVPCLCRAPACRKFLN